MSIFQKEEYYGNIEYKRYFYLNNHNPYRFQKYTTQLNYRLYEGDGKAIYIIGVDDNGSVIGLTDSSINENLLYLKRMCEEIKVTIKLIMNCYFKNKKFLIVTINSDKHRDNF